MLTYLENMLKRIRCFGNTRFNSSAKDGSKAFRVHLQRLFYTSTSLDFSVFSYYSRKAIMFLRSALSTVISLKSNTNHQFTVKIIPFWEVTKLFFDLGFTILFYSVQATFTLERRATFATLSIHVNRFEPKYFIL